MTQQLLVYFGCWLVFGTIIGLLAYRKNRNGLLWGAVGGLFLIPGLLLLMFMPFICPQCKRSLSNSEWKSRQCPECGAV